MKKKPIHFHLAIFPYCRTGGACIKYHSLVTVRKNINIPAERGGLGSFRTRESAATDNICEEGDSSQPVLSYSPYVPVNVSPC